MKKNKNTLWFTLIETLVGVLIFSIIIIAGFSALNAIMVGKVKLIERTAIQKEAFYFSEKLFEMIKTWGTIDYEEYWNRFSYDTQYGSGHFLLPSGFGNYWVTWVLWGDWWWGPYSCISKDGENMPATWCLRDFNIFSHWWIWYTDVSNTHQKYTQYSEQFIDYNSDADGDMWNEDWSWEAQYAYKWDDDDLYLWRWPAAFLEDIDVWELYLINALGNERTYFRWNVIDDPNAPGTLACTGTQNMIWDWCLWTVEFLKLVWDDAWFDHADNEGSFDNDGIIDTWYIHPDFSWGTQVVAWSDGLDYWQPLFPDTIHVKDIQFFPYPNKDLEYSWRDADPAINISPYVRISMTLAPSWKSRKKIRGQIPEIEINTTVQLTDIFN